MKSFNVWGWLNFLKKYTYVNFQTLSAIKLLTIIRLSGLCGEVQNDDLII